MPIQFRKAVASEAKPLIGLYAESGRGKTYGALLLAKGFIDDMSQVVMIETEAGRGEVHASDPILGGYNVIPIRETFSPAVYGQAIALAEKEGAKVLIIDSASHEWEGVGGVLAMAEELRKSAGAKGMWRQPKMDHAREFMLRMTQTPIDLVICCMRAKYPMYEVTAADVEAWKKAGSPGGKEPKKGEWARSFRLEPKQSDDILSEMFVHGWIDEEHRFRLTKETISDMLEVFKNNEPLSIETGKRLAAWAKGRVKSAGATEGAEFITPDQVLTLESRCTENGIPTADLKAAAKVDSLALMPPAKFDRAMAWIDKAIAKKKEQQQEAA